MVRKSLHLTLRFVAWLIASAAILVTLAVWRLSAGPVAIDFLVPYVEDALTPASGEVTTTLDGAAIRFGADGAPVLAGTGLRVSDAAGAPLIDLPEIEIAFSARALLLRQLLAPVRLEAVAPGIVLTRRPDGSIGLRGTAAGESGGVELGLLAAPIMAEPDPREPLSYLRRLRIDGASLVLEDEVSGSVIRTSGGALTLLRTDGHLGGVVTLNLERPDHDVGVTARFRLHEDGTGASVSAVVGGFQLADLRLIDGFLDQAARRRLAALPLEAAVADLLLRVSAELDQTGRTDSLDVSLSTDGGRIELPAELAQPLDLGRLRLQGRVLLAAPALEVERLDLALNGARLSGNGRLELTAQGPLLTAELAASDVAATELPALWPLRAADDARDWVTSNITAGTATAGEVSIDLRPADIGTKPLRKGAVTGWFAYDDLTIRYFEELPPVTGVDGRATFDAQTMTFTPTAGAVGALRLRDGRIEITGMGIEGRDSTQLEVGTVIEGPLPDALALIDHPPFGFAAEVGLDPAATSGTTRTDLRIGLPLYKDVRDDDLRLAASATLDEVEIGGLLGRIDVAGGTFALEVNRDRLELDGRASLAGVAADIAWEEVFDDARPLRRRLVVAGTVEPATLRALGIPDLPVAFEGGIRSDLEYVESTTGFEAEGSFDLEPARLAVAPLDWRKPLGGPGMLSVRLAREGEGPLVIEDLELAAEDVDLRMGGVVSLAPMEIVSLDVQRLTFRGQRLSATVARAADGGAEVDVAARVLDLRPFLGDGDGTAAAADDGEGGGGPDLPAPLMLRITADRLVLADETPALSSLEGHLVRERRGWREAELRAQLPNDVPVRLEYRPAGAGGRLLLTTDDAGELLRTLDRKRRIQGGRLRLEAEVPDRRRPFVASGQLALDAFKLRDAPLMARLLSVASLQGIGDVLQGEGLSVDRLELPFALADDVLTLSGGRLSGSQLGLTVEGDIDLARDRLDLTGTLVPVYGLNIAIGKIPLLGDFLSGTGDAAFAATYAVVGPFAEPEVSVNPLSVLAPGFIRELFAGMRDGTLEPPDLPEDRN